MTSAAVQKYVEFCREFISLCLCSDWPGADSSREEVTRALDVAHHVERAINKMKLKIMGKSNYYDTFLHLLCEDKNFTNTFLYNCMEDPPKFILKKIINSDAPINYIDIAFKRFQQLYSKDRLVAALSDLMLEKASKEILLKNMYTALPDRKVQEVYCHLHLFAVLECDSNELLCDMLKDCKQAMIDSLVLCLVNDNLASLNREDISLIRRKVINGFTTVMACRDTSAKMFWELLFNVDKQNLVEMCLKYKVLACLIFDALADRFSNRLPIDLCVVQIPVTHLNQIYDTFDKNEKIRDSFSNYMTTHL